MAPWLAQTSLFVHFAYSKRIEIMQYVPWATRLFGVWGFLFVALICRHPNLVSLPEASGQSAGRCSCLWHLLTTPWSPPLPPPLNWDWKRLNRYWKLAPFLVTTNPNYCRLTPSEMKETCLYEIIELKSQLIEMSHCIKYHINSVLQSL